MANALSVLSRAFVPAAARSKEGEYRPGPYMLSNGWLGAKAGTLLNWWQSGHSLRPYGESGAIVEACISAYAQTVAMCPGDHWRLKPGGGRVRVENSALVRVLRSPNDYQSMSDLLLNLTRRLYAKGEGFGYARRNDRNEITEVHLMERGKPLLGKDGSIFYALAGNEIAERRFDLTEPVPARDVLHVKLHTPLHPLRGASPIMAAGLELALSGAALSQQVTFYLNEARPSFMLETDEKLTTEQTRELRALWNEQTQGEGAGGTPILTWGLKAKPVSQQASDSRLAEMLKLTDQNVALAFRMPLQILGLGGAPFASTEALMSSWKAMGLGFALNHIEEAFGKLFGLKGMPDEYLEFNTKALLRSNFKEMIEGLSRAAISGIMAPDEARAEMELSPVAGGHGEMPRVQQQVVPLSYGSKMEPPKVPAEPIAPVQPEDDALDDDEAAEAAKSYLFAEFKELDAPKLLTKQ